jgi:hypothetical protein
MPQTTLLGSMPGQAGSLESADLQHVSKFSFRLLRLNIGEEILEMWFGSE